MNELGKNYSHRGIEDKWQSKWSELGINKWDESQPRDKTFVIDTPPPTVSGYLHMGHIFGYTQTDFIARFQRMRGKNVFYPMGFDDNGLPTERYVEKLKNIKAAQIERNEFITLCNEVSQQAEDDFRKLFKSIALSVDWTQEYRTISHRSHHIAQLSFLDLYHKGHIKRDSSPVFWDTTDRTAIAQTEIEDREETGIMSDIIFSSPNREIELVISTTRPELIPACVALLYHPDDERYNKLKITEAITPIFNKKIPVMADYDVEIKKGTGLVMCCTFGDIQDLHWQKRHNLKIKQCIDLEGQMQNAGILDGLKTDQAREGILKILKENALIKKQTNITHTVKCAERSGTPLELLPTDQWYIIVMDKKEKLIEKARECSWHPDYMRIRLENWINGLNQEWCISRQRYSGIPFPVWYSKRKGEEGKILIANIDQLPVNPLIDLPYGYEKHEVEPDMDIMDTWATSAVSPQLSSLGIANGYMIDQKRHEKLFPGDLRPNGHDIIRTWDFCTIVKALLHENTIPWKNVMISGWCMTQDKLKMSKSKENAISPVKLLEEKGADVVRYWTSTSTLGTDIVFSEEKFHSGKRLINKLWNAAKFCQIHIMDLYINQSAQNELYSKFIKDEKITHATDIWIVNKLNTVVKNTTKALENFEYYEARNNIELFFWNDFCDNYLELIKGRIYRKEKNIQQNIDKSKSNDQNQIISNAERISAKYALYCSIETLLRLFAPFLPHITEEIYQNICVPLIKKGKNRKDDKIFYSIHDKNQWPNFDDFARNESISKAGESILIFLELIRKFKSEHNMSLNGNIDEIEIYTDKTEIYVNDKIYNNMLKDLQSACNAQSLKIKKLNLYRENNYYKRISSIQLKDSFINIKI